LEVVIDIAGWVGSVCLVTAYGLNSYQVIKSDSFVFYLLNIIGGIFLIVYSVSKAAYANTFINVVWVVITIPAFFRLLFRR
jgi:hypothetical protein